MTFKAFFRQLSKALNPYRPEKYYQTLANRFYSKIYDAQNKILRMCRGLPSYVYSYYITLLKNKRLHTYTNDFEELRYEIKTLDELIGSIFRQLNYKLWVINKKFPSERKPIEFKNVKFLEVTDCNLDRYIGYAVHVKERGNGVDFHFIGKFFNKNGVAVEINEINETYLVKPLTKNDEFTRYINLYSKELSKKPIGTQQAELSLLYDAWNVQQNYLTQIENEERSL